MRVPVTIFRKCVFYILVLFGCRHFVAFCLAMIFDYYLIKVLFISPTRMRQVSITTKARLDFVD